MQRVATVIRNILISPLHYFFIHINGFFFYSIKSASNKVTDFSVYEFHIRLLYFGSDQLNEISAAVHFKIVLHFLACVFLF
jgi:hypothetical protein